MGTDGAHSSSLINITWVNVSRYFKARAEVGVVNARNNSDRLVSDLILISASSVTVGRLKRSP